MFLNISLNFDCNKKTSIIIQKYSSNIFLLRYKISQFLLLFILGPQKIGIFRSCVKIAGRNDFECYRSLYNVEWLFALFCILCASCSNFGATTFLMYAHWKPEYARKGRWLGVVSVILFCLATVIFPAGFNRLDIGGAPYQLPGNCRIGIGYIFFMLALWVAVVGELVNAKIFGSR